jgi:hypothetical protein
VTPPKFVKPDPDNGVGCDFDNSQYWDGSFLNQDMESKYVECFLGELSTQTNQLAHLISDGVRRHRINVTIGKSNACVDGSSCKDGKCDDGTECGKKKDSSQLFKIHWALISRFKPGFKFGEEGYQECAGQVGALGNHLECCGPALEWLTCEFDQCESTCGAYNSSAVDARDVEYKCNAVSCSSAVPDYVTKSKRDTLSTALDQVSTGVMPPANVLFKNADATTGVSAASSINVKLDQPPPQDSLVFKTQCFTGACWKKPVQKPPSPGPTPTVTWNWDDEETPGGATPEFPAVAVPRIASRKLLGAEEQPTALRRRSSLLPTNGNLTGYGLVLAAVPGAGKYTVFQHVEGFSVTVTMDVYPDVMEVAFIVTIPEMGKLKVECFHEPITASATNIFLTNYNKPGNCVRGGLESHTLFLDPSKDVTYSNSLKTIDITVKFGKSFPIPIAFDLKYVGDSPPQPAPTPPPAPTFAPTRAIAVDTGVYADDEMVLGIKSHVDVTIHTLKSEGIDMHMDFTSTKIDFTCPKQPYTLRQIVNSSDLEVLLTDITAPTNCIKEGLVADKEFPLTFQRLTFDPVTGLLTMGMMFDRVVHERITFLLARTGPVPIPTTGRLNSSYGCSGTHGVVDDDSDDDQHAHQDPLTPTMFLAGLGVIVFLVCGGCIFDVRRARRDRDIETVAVEEAASKGQLNFRPDAGGGGYGLVFRQVTYDVPDRDQDRVKARRLFRSIDPAGAGGRGVSPLRSMLQATSRSSRATSNGSSSRSGADRGNMTAQYAAAREAAERTAVQAKEMDENKLRILDGVSGNVAPGQLVAILGASGSVSVW